MNSDLIPAPKNTGIETAASATAALAKATIEAKFVIALRPEGRRQIDTVRESILEACRRPLFAQSARWRKIQGRKEVNGQWEDNWIEGWTIRFAETAIQSWKNLDISTIVAFEDEDKRIIRTVVTDLESNISYTEDSVIEKKVERSSVRDGQIVLGERKNTKGKTVYIVRATEDEIANRINSARSKAIRNSGLRMIPSDILEEALEQVLETKESAKRNEDVAKAVPKLLAAFGTQGVSRDQIKAFLKCDPEKMTADQLEQMREMFSAIKEKTATWADFEVVDPGPTIDIGPAATTTPTPTPTPTPEPKPAATVPPPEPAKPKGPSVYLTALRTNIKRENIDEAKLIKVIHGMRRETEGTKTLEQIDAYPNVIKEIIASWQEVSAILKDQK